VLGIATSDNTLQQTHHVVLVNASSILCQLSSIVWKKKKHTHTVSGGKEKSKGEEGEREKKKRRKNPIVSIKN
jgi:hypothetical protein